MNKTINNIVNVVLSARTKKPAEFEFKVGSRDFVLYPNGEVWRRKNGRDTKLKYFNREGRWVTDIGRPALVLKDMATKLNRRLEVMAPKGKRGTKIKLPEGAKPTPVKKPEEKIDRISSRKKIRPLAEGLRVSKSLVKRLSKLGLSGIEVAGSIRRKSPTVGDIDAMAIGNINVVKDASGFEYIKGKDKSITFMFKGHQVNLYAYKKSFYGAMLLFLTGPGDYNIALRRIAKAKGMKLSQYGLFDNKGKLVAAKTEESVYRALGKHWKEPSLRGSKEKKAKIPKAKISWSKLRKDADTYVDTLSEDQLVEILDKAADKYYNTGKPLITDSIFDLVWDELKLRNPKHPRLKKVGAPVRRKIGKFKLPFYLPSLDKLKPNNVNKWLSSNPGPYLVSDKMDGLSLGVHSINGQIKLFTRGTGREGQDISHLVPMLQKFKKLPKILPNNFQARAEIEMPEAIFRKYFPEGKNARNQVSGLIGQKVPDENQVKHMDIIAYEVIYPVVKPSDQIRQLKKLKFQTVHCRLINKMDADSLSKYLLKRKKACKYEIDGLVIYQDKKVPRVKSGNPKHARAFKMMMEGSDAIAKVIKVHWKPSKHSYLKPRIEIEPTMLSGAEVKFATAFNGAFVLQNKIGPGAKVRIVRSGEVIPHILEVVKPAKEAQMPLEEYVWNDSRVDIMLPSGAKSDTVILKNLENFFKTLGVEGFKLKTIEKLYKVGYNTVPKIITITKSELLDIPGIQEKTAEMILSEIVKAIAGVEIHKLAFGSGVFGRTMGSTRLKEIFSRFPSLYKKSFKRESVIELISSLPGYQTKTATEFAEGLPRFIEFLKALPKTVKIIEPKEIKKLSSKLEGESVVFTGFRDPALEKAIKENGGDVSNSVSSKTTILLLKDPDSSTTKAEKARSLGIKLMTPDQFRSKYNVR